MRNKKTPHSGKKIIKSQRPHIMGENTKREKKIRIEWEIVMFFTSFTTLLTLIPSSIIVLLSCSSTFKIEYSLLVGTSPKIIKH